MCNIVLYFYCRTVSTNSENRDSGVSDVDLGPLPPYPPVKNNKPLLEVSFEKSSSQQVTPKRPALTVT